jgi:hypothetical protein
MKLIRNAQKVHSVLRDLPGQPVTTSANLTIHVPVRFTEIGLASVGSSVFIYGLFAMILDSGEYALCNVNALVEIKPSLIERVVIGGNDYLQFKFFPGDTVIVTKELVCRSSLIYTAINEFVFKGKVPYYVDYDDVGKLFDTAKKHAKTSATILPSAMEFLAAFIARSKQDRTKFIRETAESFNDFHREKLEWVPLQSVYWSAPNTVNKLAGAYGGSDGIVSAIVNPTHRAERIEKILRA